MRCRAVSALLAATTLVLLAACSGDTETTTTLTITQQPPELASFEIPVAGDGSGTLTQTADLPPAGVLAFDAEITDPDGREGILIGYLLTADLPDARTGETLEERVGTLVYAFGEDELVVTGGTSYPLGSAEMAAGQPQRRAVVGGTGRYLGVRGEVVTTRNGDGTYSHEFTLVD
jgi:hypothetical protein